jgi:hypothetical protein
MSATSQIGYPVFPQDPADFTPDFLTALLRGSGHLVDGAVATVKPTPVGAGVGIVGQLLRLELTYSGDPGGLPPSMVVKFPSPYPQTKDIAQHYGFYRTEVECYRRSAVGGLGVTMPKMFVAETSPDDRDTVLIIEDLSHLRVGDQVVGASVADAELLMDAAAALHARWWQSPELDSLPWLRPANNPAYKAGEQQYQQVWPLFLARYGDLVAPGSVGIAERYGREIVERLDWVVANRPLTLSHTDYRLDNFFFDDTNPSTPSVIVIDWQLSVRNFAAQDVSYFLVQSMTVDDRRTHGDRLIRRWYDGLVALGVRDYSWDDAYTDFRRAVLGQLSISVVGSAMEAGNERGQQLLDAMVTRNFQALIDYDCASL